MIGLYRHWCQILTILHEKKYRKIFQWSHFPITTCNILIPVVFTEARYSWVNKFSYFLNPYAINVLLYGLKPRKHIHVKYCWQTYVKSIGTLSQIFKNHIHNKWCVPSASDVFLSKNDNSGGKPHEASEGVEYDFCSVWSHVLVFTHCSIKLIYLL